MSNNAIFWEPYPAFGTLRELAEEDRRDVLLVLNYLVRDCSRIPTEFETEFDGIAI